MWRRGDVVLEVEGKRIEGGRGRKAADSLLEFLYFLFKVLALRIFGWKRRNSKLLHVNQVVCLL